MRGCFVFLDVFCVFCCTQFERCVVCCHTGQTKKEEDRENDAFRILSLSLFLFLFRSICGIFHLMLLKFSAGVYWLAD